MDLGPRHGRPRAAVVASTALAAVGACVGIVGVLALNSTPPAYAFTVAGILLCSAVTILAAIGVWRAELRAANSRMMYVRAMLELHGYRMCTECAYFAWPVLTTIHELETHTHR